MDSLLQKMAPSVEVASLVIGRRVFFPCLLSLAPFAYYGT